MYMNADLPWLNLHLPLYVESGAFDGFVALNGEPLSAKADWPPCPLNHVARRPFDWHFGKQANALISACELEGYDAMLRIDPDECMLPKDMLQVWAALDHHPDKLIGLSRRHFVGDRLHVHRDWGYDPQWRAWWLHRGVRYPEDQRVHEVPSHNDRELLHLTDAWLFHYGYIKPVDEIDFRTATYDALQRGVELPKRADYAGRTLNIPSVPFTGEQPLDPNVIGARAPFDVELS